MVAPRNAIPRGRRAVGPPARRKIRDDLPDPETVADPQQPRQLVDYTLQRRAALRQARRQGFHGDVCDADHMLLRTAKWHGEPSERLCPVCRREHLTHLTYTFGAEMGEVSGRVRASTELAELAHEYGAFRVYVVEVCRRCSWNHLVLSYVLGDGMPRTPGRTPYEWRGAARPRQPASRSRTTARWNHRSNLTGGES